MVTTHDTLLLVAHILNTNTQVFHFIEDAEIKDHFTEPTNTPLDQQPSSY